MSPPSVIKSFRDKGIIVEKKAKVADLVSQLTWSPLVGVTFYLGAVIPSLLLSSVYMSLLLRIQRIHLLLGSPMER